MTEDNVITLNSLLEFIKIEMIQSYEEFPNRQASYYAGWKVLLNVADELQAEVKSTKPVKTEADEDIRIIADGKIRKKAIRVAAMALRLVMDKDVFYNKWKVYVGAMEFPYGRMLMSHMGCKDIESLHKMAHAIGVRRKWFQDKQGHPHYDICKAKKQLAIKLSAVEVSDQELIRICYPKEQWKQETALI